MHAKIAKTLVYAFLIVMAVAFIFPIIILFISGFKTSGDVFTISLIPHPFTLDSYRDALTPEFLRALGNSLFISIVVTLLAMILHSMCGYALARLEFPGRKLVFGLIVATLMVPLSAILIPQFMVTKMLGMTNSYWGLIIPQLFNAYGIFLFRQFYMDFPKELEEAAELDGCGVFRRFFTIVLPLSRPMVVPLIISFFLASWNNYMWPLIVNKNDKLNTLQVYLANLVSGYSVDWNILLATAALSVLPVFVLFFFVQKQLKEGDATVGIK